MSDGVRISEELDFCGELYGPVTEKEYPLPLSDPEEDGLRRAFVTCCDCGKTHIFASRDEIIVFEPTEEQVEKVLQECSRRGIEFPLKRDVAKDEQIRVEDLE